jgi:beta-lactamase superfamily II metal-dependent hydrolase
LSIDVRYLASSREVAAAQIRATGARVLRTDLAGTVTVTFEGEGLVVESAA